MKIQITINWQFISMYQSHSGVSLRWKLKQLVLVCLAVFLTLAPVYPALAEDLPASEVAVETETAPVDTSAESEAVSSDADFSEKSKAPAKGKPGEIAPEPESQNSLMGGEQADPSSGNVAGASKQRLPDTDANTGALIYEYPITVPPGRNGLQPDLRLQYNNQNTEDVNLFDYGWSINIPYIERVNKTGTNNLYSSSYFTSSLSGELVNVSGGNYRAKVDNGEFLDYSLSSNVWTVKDKTGTTYKFGSNAAERQDNPSDSSKIYKWMLQEVRDTNNNYIK